GVFLRLLPHVRELRRHGPRLAVQGAGVHVPGLCLGRGRARQDDRHAQNDVRAGAAAGRVRFPDCRHWPVRHRRDPLVDGERPEILRHPRRHPPNAVLQTWKKLLGLWMTSIRSCIVGCWMGITPGGATPASFMSYGLAKRFSKRGGNFGKGEIEGVVAPETAAHAAGTSALLPMLTLGIPGSPTAAVLLGGLLIWGLQPGPMLFVEQ